MFRSIYRKNWAEYFPPEECYDQSVSYYNTKEREALKVIKTWQNCCARVQDKHSRFAVISNIMKKLTRINKSSFTQLPHDILKALRNFFFKKWNDLKVLDKNGLTVSKLIIVNLEQCMREFRRTKRTIR